MAERFARLEPEHQRFIDRQQVFFVASAAPDGHINLSPKGQDTLRVTADDRLLWLNLTGSGNETAAHLAQANRMTLMWCAFEGPPLILRVYGSARVIHPRDADWQACSELIPAPLGARQYFDVQVEFVQTSCGYGVPLFEFRGQREALAKWTEKRGPAGIQAYWQEVNATSLDGLPTGIAPG